ncbi:MAG TPA: sigma-70 family RNA polymerase sigma factor [Candidatus Binatia bacterium]|nr:sigma-70 family RNA polymerase sigma factor [Candidatus Binatia bacterium]
MLAYRSMTDQNFAVEGLGATVELPLAAKMVSASLRSNRKRTAEPDDVDLIERLQAGDEAALEAIFNRYSAKLYNVAQRILGEVADAEEVIQDVFWTAFRKAKSFRGTAQFSTWLYRLTVNAALGKIRRSKKNKEVEYEEYLPKFQKDGHHLVRPVVDWSDTLDEKYAEQELQQLLKDALDQLKPVDKSVVVLSDLEGMSDKEIAGMLGLTVPAVKTRLHRARLLLRGKLAIHLRHSAS